MGRVGGLEKAVMRIDLSTRGYGSSNVRERGLGDGADWGWRWRWRCGGTADGRMMGE